MKLKNKKMSRICAWLIIVAMLSGMLPTGAWADAPGAQLNGLNNYVVELSSDPSTSSRLSDFGTADADGLVWADKSVAVNGTQFDVTLSALAQEYVRTSTSVVREQAAADVAMVLDMSTSMTEERVTKMKDAVNKGIDIIMAANPRNRIGIYYYGLATGNTGGVPNVGTLFPLASYSTPLTGDGTDATDRYITSGSTVISGSSVRFITRNAGVTQKYLDGTTGSTAAQTIYTSGGTATQTGLYTAINALKTDIAGRTPSDEDEDSERVPYVLLLTDGEANKAYANWYNSPPNGTERSGSGANGTAEISALTVLSAAKLKDELKTAYSAHSGGKDVVWFNVAFGLNEGNNLATALLKPGRLASATSGNEKSVYDQLITLTNNASTENKKYGIGGTTGYLYATEYIYFVAPTDLTKVDEALGDLAELVEAATQEKIIPFERTSVSGDPLNLLITDVLGAGMELKSAPTMGAVTGTASETGTVTTYEFSGLGTTVKYDSATRELKWIIIPDEVPLIMFSDRQEPEPGYYSNPGLLPVQLTYTVGLKDTYESGTFYSNEYADSATATARFIPNADNPYYYKAITAVDDHIESTPREIGNGADDITASEPKSNNITDTAVAVYANEWSVDSDMFITRLGNNGKITPHMKIEMTPASDSVLAGDKVTYQITVTNLTDSEIADVIVNAALPSGLTFANGSMTEDSVPDLTATFPYTISSVPSNGSGSVVLTFEAAVSSSATEGTEYISDATITSVGGTSLTTPATVASDKVTVANTFSPSVTLKLDGASYAGQTVQLWKDNASQYNLLASGGIYSASGVTPGTYDIYVNDVNTGIQLSDSNANQEINYYSVSFYDGAQKYTTPAAQTILAGGKAVSPTAPTKVGYTFDKWVTTDGGSTAFDFNAAITSTTDIYATWTPNTDTAYTVNHYQEEVNGSNPAVPTLVETLEGTTGGTTSAEAKTYTGFTAQTITQETIAADGSTVVNIYYERNLYDIAFVIDPIKGTTADETTLEVVYGATPTAPDITDKPGYEFTGWNPAIAPVSGDATYTAQFDLTEFLITYDLDGGSDATANPDTYTIESADITLNNPTKTGYTFGGWTGTGLTGPTTNVTIEQGSTGARSYVATWAPNNNTAYTVNHYQAEVNGSSPADPTQVDHLTGTTGDTTSAEAKTYAGFTTVAFTQETIAANGSTVVNIYYTRNLYDIAFVIDPIKGTTADETTLEVVYGATPTAPDITDKPGYEFTGWNPAIAPVSGDATYTAQFDLTEFLITYDLDGGSDATANPDTYTIESADITLNNPTKTGYTFGGWTGTGLTEPTASVTITLGSTGVKSYVANWIPNTDTAYTVNHYQAEVNGSSPADPTQVDHLTGTTGDTTSAQAKTYTGFTAVAFTQETIAANGSTVVNIYYTRNLHDITFAIDSNKGTFTGETAPEVVYGATPTAPNVTAKPGYTFTGWDKTIVPVIGDETYTAQFDLIDFSITYNLDHGTVDPANPTIFTVEDDDFTLTNPIKAGYTFTGWTGTGLSEPTLTVTVAKGSTGDRIYTATWTANTSIVALDDNGGSGGSGSVTATYDQPMPAATAPSQAGYTFVGYFDQTSGGTKYYNADMSSATDWDKTDSSVTLYAVWTEIGNVTIQYVANNTDYGLVSRSYESLNPEIGEAAGSEATEQPGYRFVEWQDASGNTISTSAAFIPQKADGSYEAATYTAIFAAEVYQITYNLDAWTVNPSNPATYTIEDDEFTLINPTKPGFTFVGWTGTGLSEPSLTVTVAQGSTGDRSYTPTWEALPSTGDYTVIGTVVDDDTPPVSLPGATVEIVKGNTQYGDTAVTDADGNFTIHGVPAGTYNLKITFGEKTAIIAITVGGDEQVVQLGYVIFPYNASSALKLQGSDTPAVVIDNLHPEAVDYLLNEYGNTGFVKVEMVVERIDEATNDTDILEAITKINTKARSENLSIGIYLDMIIEKFYRITEAVSWNSEGLIERTNGLIKVIVPIPADLHGKSGYQVYRYHGNDVNVISTVPNADGEYLVLDQSDWTLTLYVRNFSVYAIAYNNPPIISGPTNYVITFDGDEGALPATTQTVAAGALLTKPADPQRPGYIFEGWYKADGSEWNFGTDRVYSNLTLTAKWTRDIPALDKVNHFAYMQGYPDKTFGPQKNMTRAEVTVMFARLLVEKMDVDKQYPSKFKDVDPSAWYANAIGYMEQYGIITGYSDGTFRPNATITRAEFAAIASRFDELIKDEPVTFTDVTDVYWARDYISFAASKGWIKGYPDGTFKPENYITRAEVVSLVNRMLERYSDRGYVDNHKDDLNQYVDLTSDYWAYYDIMEATNSHDYKKTSDSETWISHTK